MLIIRKVNLGDEIGIAKVHVDTWKNTYRGLVSDNYLNKLNYNERELKWKDVIVKNENILLVVETEEGNIIGYAFGGANRIENLLYSGELYALYILKEYQHQGIGKSLLKSFAKELKIQGYANIIIKVLDGNSAYEFYEKHGGQKLGNENNVVDGVSYNEIIYGWVNIDILLD